MRSALTGFRECGVCKRNREFRKLYKQFPRLMVLKPVRATLLNFKLVKNETKVESERSYDRESDQYNYDIDLTEFAHPDALKHRKNYSYRLIATVNHSGGVGFGHYTSI